MRFLVLFALLWLHSCAVVEAPKGGEVDKTPPELLATYPMHMSTLQATDLKIQIQFSEWMQNPIPSGAVQISPPFDKPLKTEVDGDKITIQFPESLDTLTTYTLIITNTVADLRRNGLTKPVQFVFSTGPSIDSLMIEGMVLLPDSMRAKKIFPSVGLYPIGSTRESKKYLKKIFETKKDSTLSAFFETPYLTLEPLLYLAQTDSLGLFRIRGIAPGTYRLAVFNDQNKNNKIDVQSEIAGVGEKDIVIQKGQTTPLEYLTLQNQDTVKAELQSVEISTPNMVRLDWTSKVDLTNMQGCGVWGMDSVLVYKPKLQWLSLNGQQLFFWFDSVAKDSKYWIGCNVQQRIKKTWFPVNDSLPQRLLQFRLKSLATKLDTLPEIELTYQLPLQADTLSPKLVFVANADTIFSEAKNIDAVRILIKPKKALRLGLEYQVLYHVSSQDSLKSYKSLGRFELVGALKRTKLQGKIPKASSTHMVRFISENGQEHWKTYCNSDGTYLIQQIPLGRYKVDVFNDRNLDSVPDAGRVQPYEPAGMWRPLMDIVNIENMESSQTLDSLFKQVQFP